LFYDIAFRGYNQRNAFGHILIAVKKNHGDQETDQQEKQQIADHTTQSGYTVPKQA
jgi:predicted DNA binding CopG/RHH family protein